MSNELTVKHWTAKRKAAVVMDTVKGKATVAKVAREHDLTVSDVEGRIEEAQRNMESGFRSRPRDIREQYASELRETKEALGECASADFCLKKVYTPARRKREPVRSLLWKWPRKATWYHSSSRVSGEVFLGGPCTSHVAA